MYDNDHAKLISYYDLGQATFAMMVAAADLGIGTGHSSVGDQDRARAILGVPADHEVAFLLSVVYPADRPLNPSSSRTAGSSTRSCGTAPGSHAFLTDH